MEEYLSNDLLRESVCEGCDAIRFSEIFKFGPEMLKCDYVLVYVCALHFQAVYLFPEGELEIWRRKTINDKFSKG